MFIFNLIKFNLPSVGLIIPRSKEIKVDLPEPLGLIKPIFCDFLISNLNY